MRWLRTGPARLSGSMGERLVAAVSPLCPGVCPRILECPPVGATCQNARVSGDFEAPARHETANSYKAFPFADRPRACLPRVSTPMPGPVWVTRSRCGRFVRPSRRVESCQAKGIVGPDGQLRRSGQVGIAEKGNRQGTERIRNTGRGNGGLSAEDE